MGNKNSGITFLEGLALVLITLKFSGYIDWPWWLVLAPVWIPFLILIVLIAIKHFKK